MSDMCHDLSMFMSKHYDALNEWSLVIDSANRLIYMTNGKTSTHKQRYGDCGYTLQDILSVACTVIGHVES